MMKRDITAVLEQAGLQVGRVLADSADHDPQPPRLGSGAGGLVERNAVVTARRHGIVWTGDMAIQRAGHIRTKVATGNGRERTTGYLGRSAPNGEPPYRALLNLTHTAER